ncbi:odorant receptor 56a-like [Malaya genurostris]|uniref:odorant receptor 56a-like n=1 Tax=Malaya genurostris TaxID=325434 RepID=UPI0026F3C16D|nr:odorant receptor 56a-like [Malaya genurostris]
MKLESEWIQEDVVLENPLLKLSLRGLKYYGVLLHRSQPWKKLNCFRAIFFTISMFAFNITQYVDLFQVWGNVSEMTANASTTLLFTTTVVRVLHLYWNRARFNAIIQKADQVIRHILHQGTEEERQILNENVVYMRRLTVGFWIFAMITANTMCVYSLIQYYGTQPTERSKWMHHPPTILRSWYPSSNLVDHFAIVYGIQLYIMCVGQLIVPCWHVFVVSLMVFVRTVLMILNYKLSNLRLYEISVLRDDFPVWESKRCQLRKKLLIQCTQLQCDIYDFTRELENLIKGAVLMDFLIFSVLLCALLFEASVTASVVQVFIDVLYITTMTAILFLYYWHANKISYHANCLSKSVFSSDWYNYPRSVNRHLLMMICCNRKQLTMKAFFVSMSLDTFIAILRASYSYFTILKQAVD